VLEVPVVGAGAGGGRPGSYNAGMNVAA
jgi:hypothetical protein